MPINLYVVLSGSVALPAKSGNINAIPNDLADLIHDVSSLHLSALLALNVISPAESDDDRCKVNE